MLPNGWAKRSGRSDRPIWPLISAGGDWVALTSGPAYFTSAPAEQVAVGTASSGGSTTWVFAEGRAGLAGHWACTELTATWTFGLLGQAAWSFPWRWERQFPASGSAPP